jgi:immune inhibitor A
VNRRITGVVGVAAALGLAATALPGNAHAVTGIDGAPHVKGSSTQAKSDDLPDPLHEKRTAVRQHAVDQLVHGKAKTIGKGAQQRIQMADGSLVSYPTSETAQLLTFLVQFGDQNTNTAFEGQQGPVHNRIPEPGVSDNSTYWESDFSPEHYKEMFFSGLEDQGGESFAGAYDEMSSGRFKLEGDVSDWVQLDKSEASYQADASDPKVPAGDETQAGMTAFIQDSANAWYQSQLDAGKTPAEIETYLQSFDQWDRYDIDGDGITNEPDGYIDHFQAIHAGTGEEDGSAPWAIWSHRWAVNTAGEGQDGPSSSQCGACGPLGGIKIGDSDLWIRDYTTEPENGGLGVFAHEFGHDLGLPDFYDTQSNDPENGTGFWTLMSSGSWMNHGQDSIGTTPNHMGPSEKLFLGWYGPGNQDLAVVDSGDVSKVDLGPSYHATSGRKQAALVLLPSGEADIETGPASSGTHYLYSGSEDDLRATAATSEAFTVPAGADLTAKVRYDLEKDYDFTYVEVSTDGTTWTPIATNLSEDDPALRNGIDGTSDASCDTNCEDHPPAGWVDLSADLAAYEGQQVQVRFRTATDGGVHYFGFAVDDVKVGDALADDFEGDLDGWDLSDYFVIDGHSYTQPYEQSYLVENRQYQGYDKTLAEGPYNFGFANSAPDRVQHYPYQDGLLVWYQNGFYGDNNTSVHPGYGQSLPVDATGARPLRWADGSVARNRINSFDATFDVDRTDTIRIQRQLASGTQLLSVPSVQSPSVFDDSNVDAYWSAANPAGSTKVAGTGTVVKVLSSDEATGHMVIEVGQRVVATTKPVISGTARVGSTLTARSATWDPAGDVTTTWQWYVGGRAVAGATGARYMVRKGDVGKSVTVGQTATLAGRYPGSAMSAATARVKPATVSMRVKAPKSVRKGKKATVTVIVTSAGMVPGGTVTVTLAGKRVTRALSHGRVTFKVPARKKGKKRIVVAYHPAAGFAGATKSVTVKVR